MYHIVNRLFHIVLWYITIIGNVGKYAAAWYQRTTCLAGSILIRWGKLRKRIPDRHRKRCGKAMGQWGKSFRKWYCIYIYNIYIVYIYILYIYIIYIIYYILYIYIYFILYIIYYIYIYIYTWWGKLHLKHLIFLRVLSGWRCFLQAQIDLKTPQISMCSTEHQYSDIAHRHGMMAQPSMSFLRLYKYYQKTWDVSKSSQKAGMKWRMSKIHQDQSVISRVIHQTVCPHWGVLTVGVKAGAWSGCSSWAAVFFL